MTDKIPEALAVLDEMLTFSSRGVDRDDPAREMIEMAHKARAAFAELIEAIHGYRWELKKPCGAGAYKVAAERLDDALAAVDNLP